MLTGLVVLLSPLALDGVVVGDLGELGANWSSFSAEACGVMVSMLSRSAAVVGGDGEASLAGNVFAFGVGEGGSSEAGDRGPPPHWLMNDSTVPNEPLSAFVLSQHIRQGDLREVKLRISAIVDPSIQRTTRTRHVV